MAKEKEKKELVTSEGARFIDRWFDDFLGRRFAPATVDEIMPDVDMFEDGGDIVVKAELPGIKKEDLEVTLTDGAITISGDKKKEKEIKKKDYYKWERSYGSFCRTLSLPSEVQADKVKSTFKDGILEVRMPKSEQAKSKEVKVKVE